ncbi:MAG: YqgE/AlgH family protein [Acidobacteria bacterium]|nr:YqgE/AlgH family protein [Acidobacteriota bacterium]
MNDAFQTELLSTAPGLLLAMPDLDDPNFQKTVVLMLEHTKEGALGLVINRETPIRVADIFETLDLVWHGQENAHVWNGGPVMREIGWILHEPTDAIAGAEVVPGIQLATTPDKMKVLAKDPPHQMRFLLGAAGWGPGQLEDELAQGAWMTADASADLIFNTPPDHMWDAAFRLLGIDPTLLVRVDGIH